MTETPDEIFERVLAEEQGKGSSPAVAQARAKAARMRAQKGLSAPGTPGGGGAPAAAAGARGGPSPGGESGESPEQVFERVLAEEQGKGSSPAVAQARAKAARMRAQKGLSAPGTPGGGGGAPAAAAGARGGPSPAAATAAAPAGSPGVARGRGAAARAARAGVSGEATPDRIQRLLAVVKPEAIQRVEKEPIDRVNTWPHLMAAEFLSVLVMTILLILISISVNAPFRELANINQTPNPSKAPWYFLGLQELLRYFHPQVAGVTIPQWLILGFMAAPFIDRNPSTSPNDRKLAIVMFTFYMVFFATLVVVGSLFRGPGFNWVYPWKDGLFYFRPLPDHGFEL